MIKCTKKTLLTMLASSFIMTQVLSVGYASGSAEGQRFTLAGNVKLSENTKRPYNVSLRFKDIDEDDTFAPIVSKLFSLVLWEDWESKRPVMKYDETGVYMGLLIKKNRDEHYAAQEKLEKLNMEVFKKLYGAKRINAYELNAYRNSLVDGKISGIRDTLSLLADLSLSGEDCLRGDGREMSSNISYNKKEIKASQNRSENDSLRILSSKYDVYFLDVHHGICFFPYFFQHLKCFVGGEEPKIYTSSHSFWGSGVDECVTDGVKENLGFLKDFLSNDEDNVGSHLCFRRSKSKRGNCWELNRGSNTRKKLVLIADRKRNRLCVLSEVKGDENNLLPLKTWVDHTPEQEMRFCVLSILGSLYVMGLLMYR